MTQYYGDFSEDDTIYIPFNTFDSNDPSASVTITNLADADIKVHKDGSATQIVTDGATIAIDFDSITGNHLITIDTSVHADYSTGSDYLVRIEGTTVDAATINAWVGSFSIENRYSAGALRPTTAGRTLDVTATGTAGIDWGNIENKTTSNDLSGTDIQLVDTATTVTGGATASALATVDTVVDAIKVVTDAQAATGTGLSAIPWNASWDAEVQSEVNDALVALGLDHLVGASVTGTDVTDNSIMARLVSSSATADWDDFVNTTDSLQAIRDRGDAAWTTGGGASITDILNVQPVIPVDIDLANTATVRLGLMLTNALDDLPSTAEITPGTIDIDRKAIGGTSWTSVVSGSACSESAGQIYFDEVFDSGTGYAEGDSIRITFKSQKIVVAANDYEVTDATGVMFQTSIRQTMRGTDSAATASALVTVDTNVDAILVDTGTTIPAQITTAQNDLDTITGADGVNLLSATQTSIDAIETDTNSLNDTKIPNTLNTTASGNIGIDWANVENPTTALDLSGTDIQLCDTITTYTGNTVQTGDGFARLGAPAGASVSADIAALNDLSAADILTTQMTESYAANGVAPTLAEAVFAVHQHLMEFSIAGTSYTVKKLDSSTTAFVETLDDATSPTGATR